MGREEREELKEGMVRLAAGDRSALPAVFRLLHPMLVRFAHRWLGGAAEADDVAQQALLKVFGGISAYDPARDPVPWAFAIAAAECRTARKRRERRREVDLDALQPLEATSPDALEHATNRQLAAALEEALGDLSPGDVATLLAAVDPERHARPDVAPATFRKRLERAFARLRSAWRARHGAV